MSGDSAQIAPEEIIQAAHAVCNQVIQAFREIEGTTLIPDGETEHNPLVKTFSQHIVKGDLRPPVAPLLS